MSTEQYEYNEIMETMNSVVQSCSEAIEKVDDHDSISYLKSEIKLAKLIMGCLEDNKIKKDLLNKKIKKIIVVPNRLVNIVTS